MHGGRCDSQLWIFSRNQYKIITIISEAVLGFRPSDSGWGRGGNTPQNFGWGCAARFSEPWPYFRPKYMIFHTPFQTWPRKSVPHFRPGFNITTRFPGTGFRLHNAPLEAVWMCLVNVKITWEINEHISENHTLFQTKKAKTIPWFQTKTARAIP